MYDLETLRLALTSLLNDGSKSATMGAYSVALIGSGGAGGTFRTFRVSNADGFFSLPSDEAIEARIGGPINSTNSLLSFPTGNTQLTSHTSGFVDLRRVHSLYIHSPSF